ncbi:hypothetical protein BBJ29_000307 [Phytophthora kernoviae]|uniref:Protein kinase domain-containing protein n=1 Tax=Phytophthora kernoviae TaxID=325452 RepID=A0A3R7K487_9STRA|nr:hypothetical protein BBJ29_000307 [Phytophthora kernoviae]
MMDDVVGFEKAAKKSWQSFSTMRRFVDEATRLENASWRLWFMQRTHASHGDVGDEPDAEDIGIHTVEERVLCVYCELHTASLSCNGCCHDAYCVSCFKLIHKKGNLATHTAIKINYVKHERDVVSSGASTYEDADLSTSQHYPKKNAEEVDEASTPGTPPKLGSLFNKPWELQMDMLLQKLMINSLHSELDISMHNIDVRESLDTADSIFSDTEDTVPPLALDESSDSDEDDLEKSNQAVVAAAVAVAGRHRAKSLSEEGRAMRSPVLSPAVHPSPSELPSDVFEQLRNLEKADKTKSFSNGNDPSGMALTGWAYLKEPGRKWCKRFLSLYRNNLWEYLDVNESSRPVGHANLFEGSVHPQQRSTTEFVLKYNRHSSANSSRNELWLRFDSEKDAVQWKEKLSLAAKLQIDDLFDLTPDSPTGSPPKNFELGKGRFSIVRRARRKEILDDPSAADSRDCALKIIEKNIFWDLVAKETEREDTVVREILTQSLLTIRAGSSYCPVIRLQSLFETRNHLVMELELMRDGDLHEEIATKSAVDETRAAFLAASLVRAIAYCQNNGVAHRDVKLSNLALDYERNASGEKYAVIKVADFGMAAFIREDGTLKGRCGTPGFVAPEILCAGKGEAYPNGVDMFSAGVVTYTMLCGYEPFFGVNDEELIQMNKWVDYEFEEPEWSNISDEAKDLVCVSCLLFKKTSVAPAHICVLIDRFPS